MMMIIKMLVTMTKMMIMIVSRFHHQNTHKTHRSKPETDLKSNLLIPVIHKPEIFPSPRYFPSPIYFPKYKKSLFIF